MPGTMRADFDGTLNLVFQPAEEGLGGARRMTEEGLFETTRATASSPCTTRRASRKGTWSCVMALQSIVSRNIDPLHTAVITVGALHAGMANNVIPQSATLELSVRALDRTVRQTLETRIPDLVHPQAQSYGVKADITYRRGYPVLVNTPAETDFARRVALDLLGENNVTMQGDPLTESEDFAFMPGAYLLIGNGDGSSAGAGLVHNPKYDFNDANLPVGAAYWLALGQTWLTLRQDRLMNVPGRATATSRADDTPSVTQKSDKLGAI